MRLLVCGSRTLEAGLTHGLIRAVLDELHDELEFTHLVEGGAEGADKAARIWAGIHRVPYTTFRADWDRYGKLAGPLRNQKMLDEGKPDVVVAFTDKPLEDSKGTHHMVSIARVAGLRTAVIQMTLNL